VNGDLARGEVRRMKPSAVASSKGTARVGLTAQAGEDRRKAQGDERSSSSGSFVAKAVRESRDQGCNGHWILRRVPIDGRHPRAPSGVLFHERAKAVF
jgi:hypothetical protein